jgi:hypothetical protein
MGRVRKGCEKMNHGIRSLLRVCEYVRCAMRSWFALTTIVVSQPPTGVY